MFKDKHPTLPSTLVSFEILSEVTDTNFSLLKAGHRNLLQGHCAASESKIMCLGPMIPKTFQTFFARRLSFLSKGKEKRVEKEETCPQRMQWLEKSEQTCFCMFQDAH